MARAAKPHARLITGLGNAMKISVRAFNRYCALWAAFAALSLASCSAFQTAPASAVAREPLPEYTLEIVPLTTPTWDSDGYEIVLTFALQSAERFPWRYLIQEIKQTTTFTTADGSRQSSRLSLVEAFRLDASPAQRDGKWVYTLEPFQRDRHFEAGFATVQPGVKAIEVTRDVKLYPAMVENADFTFLGFAHLPRNRDGNVKTDVPPSFNRRYQERHETRGSILADDRDAGLNYHISYSWRVPNTGATPVANLVFNPSGTPDAGGR